MNTTAFLVEDPPDDVETRAAPRADGVLVDLAASLLALASFALIARDADTWLRAPVVLVFALFVPGWTLLRSFGCAASVIGVIGAIGLSIGLMMLVGESLVLFGDWKWFPVGLTLTGGCFAIGAAATWRRLLSPGFGVRRLPTTRASAPSVAPLISVCSVLVGNGLVAVGIRSSSQGPYGILGLVDVLSPLYWVGLTVLVGGIVAACYHGSRWAWLNVAALMAALHGLPGLLEPNPRFGVAWIHTGFASHIAADGTLLRSLDARFSWAGFFAAGGLIQRLTGTDSLLWIVRYAPLFYNGCAIILVALLARRMRATEMQSVVAATLFCCLNWIGQDYFAPQATGFVLYLLIITVVLYAFPADPARASRWLVRLARPAADHHQGVGQRHATLLILGCYALVGAVVISHQLTPGFLLSATLLLVVVNATRLRILPVFIAIAFLAWLSYGANAYWFGHFDNLTGSVGKVGNLVNQNVGKRTESNVVGRQVVVGSRIGLALLAWGLAAVSIVVQRMRRATPIALACLLVAPFPLLLLQPYGGEMALRVCYFSLPPACILIVQLFVPATRFTLRRSITLGVALLVLTPIFITARFGNESFEAFSNNDVALSRAIYEVVPERSTIFLPSQQTLKYVERVSEVSFRALPRGTPAELTDALRVASRKTHVYIALTESQQSHGRFSLDRPPGWMQVLRDELLATQQYRVAAEIGDNVLLEMVPE